MTTTLESNQDKTVQSFDRSMIENYMKERDFNYLRDRDGDFQLTFRTNEDIGCELTCWFTAEGENGDVYVVRVYSNKPIPRSEWGQALMFCNTWNKKYRWPKAYLNMTNPDTDTTGYIILEENIDLGQGVHQALFNDFTATVLFSAIRFWERAHQEEGF